MAKLIFVTHPEVRVEPAVAREKWDLSEKGKEELKNLLSKDFWKEINLIYTSKENKAHSVAEIIANSFGLKLVKIDGLEEVNRTSTGFIDDEKYRSAIEDFYLHPADSYKGWETAYDATERIKNSINKLRSENPSEETYVLIGHAMIGSCLSCYIRGIDPSFNEDNNILASFIVIDWDHKKIIKDWTKY